ncbi:hypothetical protein VIGAN_06082200 [Vigna angularis var. angularis]|uniref:Uncharacterized protein n=1 Tax=Vigna angularis var. angularis TaxID=157739 RepID=A0A0S3SAE4_PHAAN|nr:hypothetical protein VIGAN_06082200 [Vigna angularis var. angularis]
MITWNGEGCARNKLKKKTRLGGEWRAPTLFSLARPGLSVPSLPGALSFYFSSTMMLNFLSEACSVSQYLE